MGLALKKEVPLQITIDRFGRVVIPHEVRERLGLRPGMKLEVARQMEDAVVLKIVEEKPKIKWINGIMVFAGTGQKEDVDIVELIKQDREERDRKISGL